MGNNLFGANISGLLNAALGPGLLAGVLTKSFPTGARPGGDSTAPPAPSTTTHPFRGHLEPTSILRAGDVHKDARGVVLILGDSINTAPEPNDVVAIEGRTLRLLVVVRDPDAATYTCQHS